MTILQRYYIKEFFKILSIITLGLSAIFSLIELLDKIDDFLEGKPSPILLFQYFLYTFPKFFYFLLPISILISSLFVFSQASRNRELVVIKGSGGRMKNLLFPFVIIGILLSISGFFIGEFIMPNFLDQATEVKRTIQQKKKKHAYQEGTLWLRGTDGSLIRLELYVPEKKLAHGISIFKIQKNSLTKRIESEEASWINESESSHYWKLSNVTIFDIESGNIERSSSMHYRELDPPDYLNETVKNPEDMSISELRRYMSKLNSAGFTDAKLVVDLNAKITYPIINVFMMLLGIAIAFSIRFKSGIIAAGFGLFISFLYWLGYTFMLSLGYTGILNPLISAWFIPIVFGSFAIFLNIRIQE